MSNELQSATVGVELADDERLCVVRAGPASPVGLRVPATRRSLSVEVVRPTGSRWRAGEDRTLKVLVELELRQTDGVFVGPYDKRVFSVADDDGLGMTPELIRSLPIGKYITKACAGWFDLRVVTIDGSGVMTDHRTPERTLSPEDRLVAEWLRSKLSNGDTNKDIGKFLHITPAAAAQRISRLRAAGKLPAAETQGERR